MSEENKVPEKAPTLPKKESAKADTKEAAKQRYHEWRKTVSGK